MPLTDFLERTLPAPLYDRLRWTAWLPGVRREGAGQGLSGDFTGDRSRGARQAVRTRPCPPL